MKYNMKCFRIVVPKACPLHHHDQEQTCHLRTCQMQTLRSHPRLTESETLGGAQGSMFNKPSRGF